MFKFSCPNCNQKTHQGGGYMYFTSLQKCLNKADKQLTFVKYQIIHAKNQTQLLTSYSCCQDSIRPIVLPVCLQDGNNFFLEMIFLKPENQPWEPPLVLENQLSISLIILVFPSTHSSVSFSQGFPMKHPPNFLTP